MKRKKMITSHRPELKLRANRTKVAEATWQLNRNTQHWDTGVGAILVIARGGATAASGRIQDSPLQETASSFCTNLMWFDLVSLHLFEPGLPGFVF
jgi:hypothetical protein